MPKSSPKKIVLDTSALNSFVHGEVLGKVLDGFELIISDTVLAELRETARYKDEDGKAAKKVIEISSRFTIQKVAERKYEKLLTGRVDEGEASCIPLARGEEVDALITDDFRAAHHLRTYSRKYDFDLGLCATLLKALNTRGILEEEETKAVFETMASKRGWIGRPIYEYGKDLLF